MQDIRQGTCPLCGHNEIVEARPATRTNKGLDNRLVILNGPASVTEYGKLWSYSCRKCDFTQLFAENTAAIPIGAEVGSLEAGTYSSTRLIIGPPAPGPFR